MLRVIKVGVCLEIADRLQIQYKKPEACRTAATLILPIDRAL